MKHFITEIKELQKRADTLKKQIKGHEMKIFIAKKKLEHVEKSLINAQKANVKP